METQLPMLHCLLQHSLRSLCATDSISNSWIYAVFWRIIPRNFPPPKCEYGGSLLDRAKGGNIRNWILVWEDGFCDFVACERAANGVDRGKVSFGADIFFKMSHEVYNFGEGLVGKIASDNTHKLVYNDTQAHIDNPSSWNASLDPQPRAWEAQFISGIETIAVISVREGVIQLGSFDKVVEDINFVMSIQTKFSYLHSMYTMQRPFGSILNHSSNMFMVDYSNCFMGMMQKDEEDDDIPNMMRSKRIKLDQSVADSPSQNVYSSSPQNRVAGIGKLPLYSIPPLLPSVNSNLGAFLMKINNTNPVCVYNGEAIFDDHKCGSNKSLVDEDTLRMGSEVEEKVQAKTQRLIIDED